jgi:DNA-binding response OmpR family regulator
VVDSRAGVSVLVVCVSRDLPRDLADRITAGGGRLVTVEPLHAGAVDRAQLANTSECIAVDGRSARPSAVYRAIARLRSLGWNRGIILMIEPDAMGIVPVATAVGVDDFVTSTASTEELITRLRKSAGNRPALGAAGDAALPTGIQLHWRTHHVSCAGTRIPVTLRQMQLLDVLMARPGEIITPANLARLAWGKSRGEGSALAATFICSLRKKLAWFGGTFGIQTVRGVGYRFVDHHVAVRTGGR